MGVVYRARRDGRPVAIKTVLPALAPRFDSQARFQREVRILESLDHPHIVRFLEAGMAGGFVYFVMEYVDGISASHLVKQSGPLPLVRVIDLGCQLLAALAHAHDRGFVHRDVKPGNLLLSGQPGGEVLKLADFGLARAYQTSLMSGLTTPGQSGGTPAFMPPEQVREFRMARPAADQYSAAATLYYLATGQHIYEQPRSAMDLMARILQEEPIPLRAGPPHPALVGALGPVLCRALRRQPEERYDDVRALRNALKRASRQGAGPVGL
jgi:serine/threonine-protein kinase